MSARRVRWVHGELPAIVRAIAEGQGDSAHAESRRGGGARVALVMPDAPDP